MVGKIAGVGDSRDGFLEFCEVQEDSFILLFLFQSACVVDSDVSFKSMASEVSLTSEAFALESVPVVVVDLGVVPDTVWKKAHAKGRSFELGLEVLRGRGRIWHGAVVDKCDGDEDNGWEKCFYVGHGIFCWINALKEIKYYAKQVEYYDGGQLYYEGILNDVYDI